MVSISDFKRGGRGQNNRDDCKSACASDVAKRPFGPSVIMDGASASSRAGGGGILYRELPRCYQLGAASGVWEPIFGNGSRTVLHSFISRLLPVPDAALGAFGYAAEIITGAIGGRERYCISLAIVLVYGAIALALAEAAILLIFLQAFVQPRWLHLVPDLGYYFFNNCVAGAK